MITIFLTLALLLVLQLYIILYISDKIKIKNEKNDNNIKFYKKFIELIVIILVIFSTCYFYLRYKLHSNIVTQITIFCELFIVTFWVYLNFVDDIFNFRGLKELVIYKSNKNNSINNNVINSNNNIFKKYSNHNNNFSFDELYPNYKTSNLKSKSKNIKDYSAYNGYPQDHICYDCGCIKNDEGYVFCGKEIPGMGVIGCSDKWGCENCKKCKSSYDNSSNKQYECKNCKCHDTIAGKICGIRGRVDGVIHKCNESCSKCLGCKSDLDTDNLKPKYLTIYPEKDIKYENIIINNLSKIDIDNIL